jgi:predicted nucleic acid-binding protein
VYALTGQSADCADLLRRCVAADVSGFVTIDALADTCHRLMLHEAFRKGLINRQNASSLQGKHFVIASLDEYWTKVRSLSAGGFAILPLDEYRFHRAHALRERHGLMTNDSILLAAADVFGINALATNDSDFDAVDWVTVYKPTDIT